MASSTIYYKYNCTLTELQNTATVAIPVELVLLQPHQHSAGTVDTVCIVGIVSIENIGMTQQFVGPQGIVVAFGSLVVVPGIAQTAESKVVHTLGGERVNILCDIAYNLAK